MKKPFSQSLVRNMVYCFSMYLLSQGIVVGQPEVLPDIGLARGEIPGQFIVVLKESSSAVKKIRGLKEAAQMKEAFREEVSSFLQTRGVSSSRIQQTYESAIQGFTIRDVTEKELELLKSDPQVKYIEPDRRIKLDRVTLPEGVAAAESECSTPHIILNGTTYYSIGTAAFGSKATVSGVLQMASPANGCRPSVLSSLQEKIAVIDRGDCDFSEKALQAQEAGAIGVIIANNQAGSPPSMGAGTLAPDVTIPVVSVSQGLGQSIKSALSGGTTISGTIDFGNLGSTAQCRPWGIERVGGGQSVTGKRAWIIDSGIDLDHPDLNVNTSLSRSFMPGESEAENAGDDDSGHGTHVAGTVAAIDNEQGVVGVAAGAEVVAVRVLTRTGGTTSTVLAGINYVKASPSLTSQDVVNISLGGGISTALDEAVSELANICKVVMSAGNNALNANFQSPARVRHPNVYTVSAMDANDDFASFSNYGHPVRYAAPGVIIASCYLDGGYAFLHGTSMAAPHIAGLLLLGVPLCSGQRVRNDPDGIADPILTVFNATQNVDNDGDGITVCDGDPDDNDASVFPGATEICDGKDNNGDGYVDEGCCPPGSPAILYVKHDATGSGNGLSWNNAFTTLQEGLSAAAKCLAITQIRVARGTYYPTTDEFGQTSSTNSRHRTFVLRNNLAILGGFAGNEPINFDLSQRDFVANQVILTGEIQGDNEVQNNVYNLFRNIPLHGDNLTRSAKLDGFTLTQASANAVEVDNSLIFPFSHGAGMVNSNASPIIENCIFRANTGLFGSAIFNDRSAHPFINRSQFLLNRSEYVGGGIANYGASSLIVSSVFQLNTSSSGGAAVLNYSGSLSNLINCTIVGNQVANQGAAILNWHGSGSILRNTIIWGNSLGIANVAASGQTISSWIDSDYSIIQGLSSPDARASENWNIDPLFVQQPAFGTTTLGDLRLQPCSPALNTGDPTILIGNTGPADVSGANRLFGSSMDLGAYELQREPFAVAITADPDLDIVTGESVMLMASGATSYAWSTGAETANITVSPTENTTYTVTGTDGACSAVVNATVTVGALPVTLVHFDAKAQPSGSVRTEWATSYETGNAYFLIERSLDLKKVERVAKILANSEYVDHIRRYTFSDEAPHPGRSYYRLVQVDQGGRETVYDWKTVSLGRNYYVYPNPVKFNRVKVILDEPESAMLKLYNVEGRNIKIDWVKTEEGMVDVLLPAQLASGMYTLTVEERAQKTTHRFVVAP
jgi:hypothetical protein